MISLHEPSSSYSIIFNFKYLGEGYELVGKQEKYCQADGAWSPKELPTCVRK